MEGSEPSEDRSVSAVSWLTMIEGALKGRTPKLAEPGTFDTAAAVTLLLRPASDRLEFLAIKRTEAKRDPWSGHMALPGGRRDAADDDLWATAVRETREEVGIDLLERGTLLGRLDDVAPRSRHIPLIAIAPFVAAVPPDVVAGRSPEVERAIWLPLEAVIEESYRGRLKLPFEPDREFPTIEYGGEVIWGLTFAILRQVEELLRAIGYPRRDT